MPSSTIYDYQAHLSAITRNIVVETWKMDVELRSDLGPGGRTWSGSTVGREENPITTEGENHRELGSDLWRQSTIRRFETKWRLTPVSPSPALLNNRLLK